MQGAILTSMIIGLLIGSAIGGLILKQFAKNVGKISNATFGNSFLVCLISSAINFSIWFLMGTDAFRMGFAKILVINLFILSATYITFGKFIWKCEWMQSFKANIIWIIVYAIFMGYTLSKFSHLNIP
jgi:hypothetical protein